MTRGNEKKRKVYIGNIVLPDRIFQRGTVAIDGEKIVSVCSPLSPDHLAECEIFDFERDFVGPGLIDLHLHGALGKDVMDGKVESLETIAGYQARWGVTGFMGATMAASLDSLKAALKAVEISSGMEMDAEVYGPYIEGSLINARRRGAHDVRFAGHSPGARELVALFEALKGSVGIITIAPEIEGQMKLIPEFTKRGFVAAIGHSDATYIQALNGFKKGISHTTHLFNAMRGFFHREPGVVGAVLDTDGITTELIADGEHVHPSAVRLALSRKGTDDICLVTDSCLAAGLESGYYGRGALQIESQGNRAVLRESQTLAGGVLPLILAVKKTVEWCGLSVFDGFKMATLNPARVLGLDCSRGSLEEGKLANLTVFDENFKVKRTILRGRQVYSST